MNKELLLKSLEIRKQEISIKQEEYKAIKQVVLEEYNKELYGNILRCKMEEFINPVEFKKYMRSCHKMSIDQVAILKVYGSGFHTVTHMSYDFRFKENRYKVEIPILCEDIDDIVGDIFSKTRVYKMSGSNRYELCGYYDDFVKALEYIKAV